MLLSHVILCALMIACDALSIGTVTEKIKEPDAEGSDFFPDWVPFKNKHGEDLGEFVQVPKAKLKKRLALPVNFVLRAVAEPEGDDYLDKGQGESDNEEYYEKKDWSDAQRAAQPAGPGAATNHTEISDIDGVVEIITKKPDTPTVKVNNNFVLPESKEKVEKEESTEEKVKDDNKTEENKSEEVKKEDTVTKVDDDSDYDETSSENPKTDIKDQTESEAKKAKILSSVDELKERHAEEQRLISEKVKEEEIFKEERERENLQRSSEEDKYTPKKKLNSIEPDYEEEYDETDSSLDEKYHVTTSTTSSTAATPPQQTTKRKGKNIQIGKLSVFKNPDLFTVGNENDVESSTTLRPTHTWPATKDTTEKYSAKYRAATPAEDTDEIERISLLPENDTDSEEPTLFFPKKTKNRRRKTKTTTPATDSSVAESVADKTAKHLSTTVDTGSSATIAVTAEAASLPEHGDAVSASTHNDKQEEKTEDYDNERGGGRDYHSHREEDHEEHGKKAYEGFHEDTKTAKGHRDKENHHGEYDDHGGVKEEHHDESGHYGAHHHEEHGKKHAKYEESGKHAKGHSTKGSHDIHKKEEYEKKVEFFEEEGDSGEEEKHGGHHEEREHKEGGHYKKGDLESGHHQHAKGHSGHFVKGGHQHVHKGHKASGGNDGHGSHGHDEHHKADRSGGKKWVYHHGHPAKTANLVLIDRRFDKYSHGPYYYG